MLCFFLYVIFLFKLSFFRDVKLVILHKLNPFRATTVCIYILKFLLLRDFTILCFNQKKSNVKRIEILSSFFETLNKLSLFNFCD